MAANVSAPSSMLVSEAAARLSCDLLATTLPEHLPLLPQNVASFAQSVLVGPHLLQVEDAVDITLTDEERRLPFDERGARNSRMLKLLLTDGVQSVCAVEHHRIDALSEKGAVGCKLLVHNVAVRRGLLMLTPKCAMVAGGGGSAALGAAAPAASTTALQELFVLGAQRVRVSATSLRLTRFSVLPGDSASQPVVEAALELSGGPEAGSHDAPPFTRELHLTPAVIEGVLGQPPAQIFEELSSDDKQVRKSAKAKTKRANKYLTGLAGTFVLGVSPKGLTVMELPQRPPNWDGE